MNFDEFFKKKRIDLIALKKAEQGLFFEFETHFEQMGEKSFDHTKKYWFNKLRRQFPLAPEIKTEKAHIANPLAEQTVTESLIETTTPAPSPKMGFVPKFRAGVTKPAEDTADKKEDTAQESTAKEQPAESTEVKAAAYQPRFKMKPKAETEEAATTESILKPEASEEKENKPAAYQPRFKMKPKVETEESAPAIEPEEKPTESTPAETAEAKAAYKPRFKMKPKVETEEPASANAPEEKPAKPTPTENPEAKPAYKPRFKMQHIKPKEE